VLAVTRAPTILATIEHPRRFWPADPGFRLPPADSL